MTKLFSFSEMVRVTLLELCERRIYVPPLGTMSIISYLKKKGVCIDYFDMSLEVIRFLEDEKNLRQVIEGLRNMLNTNFLSLKEKMALKWLIFFMEHSVINKIRNTPSSNDALGRLWYVYSALFNNHNLVNWYYLGSSFFSKIKLEYFLKLFKRNRKLSQLREAIFNNPDFKNWLTRITENSDVIAFSVPYASKFEIAVELAKTIKQTYPEKKVIVGGGGVLYKFNVSVDNEYFRYIDFFVLGEGEVAMYKLLKALKGKQSLKNVPNIAYLNHNRIVVNKQEVIKNLNILPPPEYSIYLSKYGSPPVLDLSKYNYLPDTLRTVLYEQSRGCTWQKCVFCNFGCRLNMNVPYREKNPKKIVRELKSIQERTGNNFFWFVNDLMTAKHALALSHEILKNNLKVWWLVNVRVDKNFDFSTLQTMHNAGCRILRFGLESGNQEINELIRKGVNVKEAERMIKDCKMTGIKTMVCTVIGFPMESIRQSLDTFKFISRNADNIPFAFVQLFYISPYSYIQLNPSKFGITEIVSLEENKFGAKHYWFKKNFLNMLRHAYKSYMAYKHPQTKVIVLDRIC